jgi:murein DD-endopeptidase MepM/ murein hydrolase activator NlpD
MIYGLLVLVAAYGLFELHDPVAPRPQPPSRQTEKVASTPPCPPEPEIIEGRIAKNMTLGVMLASRGFSHQTIHRLVTACKPVYNLAKLKIGNRFELERLPDGTLNSFRYDVDLDKYLKVVRTANGFQAQFHPFEYETQVLPVVGTIESSLFRTISEIKEGDQLALDMAEIFSWDIDFNTEIQRGDHFRLLVEKLYLEDRLIKYGNILGVEFYNAGHLYTGYRFEDPEGEIGYFDNAGRSLKRDFLKSPVKFSRISSRFSYRRLHPILAKRRPHLGVDYAAPTGTPVVAAGKGRVRFRGWKGGFGNYVQIRHSNGFTTSYGHLSRFARGIGRGSRVAQGQVIGYVGSTGLSTGPHLDYRVRRNGVFVNPLTLKMKPSKPLKPEYRSAFQEVKARWQKQLAAIGPPPGEMQSASLSSGFEADFIY